MNQPEFDFRPEYAAMPEHPIAVLSWRDDGVSSVWPEFGISAWFQDWDVALSCVLHPNNSHVALRIRA